MNTTYRQRIQFFTIIQRAARKVLLIERYIAFFIIWMISQFFPSPVQAELLQERQVFDVVSDGRIVNFKGFVGKSEGSTFIGLNQSIELWAECLGNYFANGTSIGMISSGYTQEMAQEQNRNCPNYTKDDLILANNRDNIVEDWHDLNIYPSNVDYCLMA